MGLSEQVRSIETAPRHERAAFDKVMELMIVKCNLCGGDDYKVVDTQRGFRMVQCRQCGLIYLNPRPLPQWFEPAYQSYLPVEPDAIARWNKMMEAIYVSVRQRLIQKFPGAGRLLDVGCAYGRFIEMMGSGGWRVEGIEINAYAGASCRRRGFKVKSQPLSEVGLDPVRYDAVTMFYVLEHLEDPFGALRKVHAALKPGGVVVLRLPHTTPIVRLLKCVGLKTQLYDAPYHLYDYSPGVLKAGLEQLGFKNVQFEVGPGTYPIPVKQRMMSSFASGLGRMLQRLSGGSYLLPGVSKTCFAEKA